MHWNGKEAQLREMRGTSRMSGLDAVLAQKVMLSDAPGEKTRGVWLCCALRSN